MSEMSDYTNEIEIRFFGQRRSGHHAIMNWVYHHFSGPSSYINEIGRIREISPNSYYKNASEEQIEKDRKGDFFRKECLILNVEDGNLQTVSQEIEDSKFYPRGLSKKIVNILVLRDPYNLFASRLKKSINEGTPEVWWIGPGSVRTWIQHAREFMNKTNLLGEGLVAVSYNHWFTDIDYRKGISHKLGLEFVDDGFLMVPSHGGGSSFDGTSQDRSANSMRVLERWQEFRGVERYEEIFENEELVRLSREIFGEIRKLSE